MHEGDYEIRLDVDDSIWTSGDERDVVIQALTRWCSDPQGRGRRARLDLMNRGRWVVRNRYGSSMRIASSPTRVGMPCESDRAIADAVLTNPPSIRSLTFCSSRSLASPRSMARSHPSNQRFFGHCSSLPFDAGSAAWQAILGQSSIFSQLHAGAIPNKTLRSWHLFHWSAYLILGMRSLRRTTPITNKGSADQPRRSAQLPRDLL